MGLTDVRSQIEFHWRHFPFAETFFVITLETFDANNANCVAFM